MSSPGREETAYPCYQGAWLLALMLFASVATAQSPPPERVLSDDELRAPLVASNYRIRLPDGQFVSFDSVAGDRTCTVRDVTCIVTPPQSIPV